MNGLALCAGGGGLELGFGLACRYLGIGYRAVGYVEREAFAAAALVARMEDAALDRAPVWDDITTFDGRPFCDLVDIISAGYPCQPFSVAGKREGEKDERHLWPEVLRIIRKVRPRFAFLENVPGYLRLGFDRVLADLAASGFDAEWGTFSAAGAGAPHKRERLFCLAYRDGGESGQPEGTLAELGGRARDVREELADADGQYDDAGGHGAGALRGELIEAAGLSGRGEELADAGSGGRISRDGTSHAGESDAQGSRHLADAEDAVGRREPEGAGAAGAGPSGDIAELAVAERAGLEGRERGLMAGEEEGRGGPDADACRPGYWPPGPGEREQWSRILEAAPGLEPALANAARGAKGDAGRRQETREAAEGTSAQPALRRVADGLAGRMVESALAYRQDRLRLLGNGVVPLTAATAFVTLWRRAHE